MNIINCKRNLNVEIITKSIGLDIGSLNGFRTGRIVKIVNKMQVIVAVVMVDEYNGEYEKNYGFAHYDLEPIWEVNKNGK